MMFKRIRAFVKGATLGAGAMYLLDPQAGRARRARIRDKLRHHSRVLNDEFEKARRDLSNRAHGLLSQLRLARSRPIDDDILVQRIRSRLGAVVSHPRSIDVEAQYGHAILSG